MNKEQLRMQMLAGIITESEYKTRLDENESLDRTVYYRVVEKGNENINYTKGGTAEVAFSLNDLAIIALGWFGEVSAEDYTLFEITGDLVQTIDQSYQLFSGEKLNQFCQKYNYKIEPDEDNPEKYSIVYLKAGELKITSEKVIDIAPLVRIVDEIE